MDYQGQWYPGKHEPLIDRGTWNRVQTILSGHQYQSHSMTFAGEWLTCGYCGRPITGETKIKKTKAGIRIYIYCRCGAYNAANHPRVRVTEAGLDQQVLAWLERMKIKDESKTA